MRELREQECASVVGGYQSLVEIGLPPTAIRPLNLPLEIEIGNIPVVGQPTPGLIPGPGGPRRRRDS